MSPPSDEAWSMAHTLPPEMIGARAAAGLRLDALASAVLVGCDMKINAGAPGVLV